MLELKNITKTFGSVTANNDVSIKIEKGTIHAIVGENGAGKSTIMRIAYGFYTADSGEILIDGRPVSIRNPHDAIALGIGMVHQHFMLVDTMTVGENIILGAEGDNPAAIDWKKANDSIRRLSDELKLGVNPKSLIEDLSVGAQQRVELLKALYRNAELLILDEPTAVLTPQEVEDFFNILRRMREQGKTIVIITHKLEEVLAISDDVTVMRDGRVVGNVKTAATSRQELARMIVGRDVLLRVEKTAAEPRDTVLKIENLTVTGKHGEALKDISLEVRAGEIVGIAGIEGNGQTELIEAIAGLIAVRSGVIEFLGKDISRLSVRRRTELGIAHIPEDRHKRGLLLDSDLEENAILGVHYRPPVSSGVFLNSSYIEGRTKEIIENFDVRPPNPELAAKSLSGGNQQKLIIGREFGLAPKLLLVSQPTRGVDIGAIEFIHRKLIGLRDAGSAILLVSAELEEVTALADRLLVIYEGKFVGEVDPKIVSNEDIGCLMTGGTIQQGEN
jgi:general nucleoside transport system ATP-binding protein